MQMYLINPRRKKKKSKAKVVTTRRRKSRKSVGVRRRRARVASPAAVRRRRGGVRRRSSRRRSMTRTFRAKGGRSISLTVRNPRRRGSRGGMLGFGNIGQEFKALFSKDNLTVAGGAVAATVATQYLLNSKRSDNKPLLPLPVSPESRKIAVIGYSLAIPFVGAMAVRKFNPGLSKGMLLGGLVNTIVAAWQQYGGPSYAKVTGTGLYLDSVGSTSAGYMATNMPTDSVGMTFEPGFSRSAF